MAAELRWILLGCSALLLAGIWWWGARRARQIPDTSLRDGAVTAAAVQEPLPVETERAVRVPSDESREWGVPPFEPLSIRTADFDRLQVMDIPMTATADPLDVTLNRDYAEQEIAAGEPEPEAADAPVAAAASPQAATEQRILTVRVCALDEARWDGAALMAALEGRGLFFGRYKVFHRQDDAGRTLFCAASLVEPGTFDLSRMPEEDYRGLTLFAVLPGPADGLSILDALIETAGDLAESLNGQVQDSEGAPLSPQRVAALRADAAAFSSPVTMGG